ncbi:MAG: hypothetical protein HYW48_03905 [Deltaproteobacteria bacterium]|nr:hypothetical protein [Deltaproteobacteria bacterium]
MQASFYLLINTNPDQQQGAAVLRETSCAVFPQTPFLAKASLTVAA